MTPKHKKIKIACITPSRIGDTLITTPTIRAIAHAFPTAEITAYVHPQRKNLLQYIPFIHNSKKLTKFSAKLGFLFWKKKYEYAFLFDSDPTYTRLGIKISKYAIAFEGPKNDINNKLYKSIKKPTNKVHSVIDKTLLANSIGINVDSFRIEYQITTDEIGAATSFLKNINIPENSYIIGLQAISFHTKSFRNWPTEYFSDLCLRISKDIKNAIFLFFGSKEDALENQKVVSALGPISHNLSGLGIRETAAIMSKCSLLIGVDTGPTHIMGSMNIPMVGIYHCLMPSRLIAPLQHPCFEPVDHIAEEGTCSNKSSIADISVDRVYQAVMKVTGQS